MVEKQKTRLEFLDVTVFQMLFQNLIAQKRKNNVFNSTDLEKVMKLFLIQNIKMHEKKEQSAFSDMVFFLNFCIVQLRKQLRN